MSFFELFKNELKTIFSDAAIVLTIIGGVLLYAFLYPQPYAKQSVSSLGISVVDLDKSELSRKIIFDIDATPQVSVIRRDVSQKDALQALTNNKIKGVVIIPPHFKRDLLLNKQPTIALGADSSYFLIFGAVLEGSMRSVLTQAAGVKVAKLLKKGMPLSGAKISYTPYTLNTINLFNPNNSYTQYVVPAVFVLILQQTLLIGMGILGGGSNERLRRREDFYLLKAKTWQIIAARYLIFGFIFFVHILFYFGFSFDFFSITHLANRGDLLTFSVAFLSASLALGLFLGSLFTSREIATPAVLFSSLPLVFSAGFVWPLEAIPQFVKDLSLLSPSTPAIQGFLKLNQMGADFSALRDNYALLWIQVVLYTLLGYYFINKQKKADDVKI